MKRIVGSALVRWGVIVVVIIVGALFLFNRRAVVAYETATVTRGAVTETVLATGQVRPKDYASLRFKTTGTIAKLFVDVGEKVSAGQTLAMLDTGELSKKVTQAEAELVSAEVALENSQQDVSDQTTKGNQALAVLYAGIPSSFNDMLNWSEQAYATFISFYDSNNQLTSSIANTILDSQRIIDANNAVVVAKSALAKLRATLQMVPASASASEIDAALAAIHEPLQQIYASLTALTNAVAAVPTGTIAASTLETYKSQLATARTNINYAISAESDATADIRDIKVQNTLSGNSKDASERSAQANLEKAKAALEIAKQNLNDAYLRAPISGTIATKSKQIGELVTTADQVYYLLGQGGLEITANVPEVDIAKISVGDTAHVDLDAYTEREPFVATVSEIDPAETLVDGIATYKVTFTFTSIDEHVRSGMTANIAIVTDEHANVLFVPQRAIVTQNGKKIVRLPPTQEDAQPTEVEITTGLRGSDGSVEVTSGLTEGATIIVAVK